MIKHERLEKNTGLLLLFTLAVISIGGLIEIVPLFYIDGSIEEVKKVISGIESEFVTSKFIENAFKISHRSKRKSKVNPKSFNTLNATS